jgi:hypothetical protein
VFHQEWDDLGVEQRHLKEWNSLLKMELLTEEVDHVREGESGGEEGAIGEDGESAQTRAGHHWCARPEGLEVPVG